MYKRHQWNYEVRTKTAGFRLFHVLEKEHARERREMTVASYTRKIYRILNVHYNDGFRILFRLLRYCSASVMFMGPIDALT